MGDEAKSLKMNIAQLTSSGLCRMSGSVLSYCGGEGAHPSPPLKGTQSKTGYDERRLGERKVHPPEGSRRLNGRGDNWLDLDI